MRCLRSFFFLFLLLSLSHSIEIEVLFPKKAKLSNNDVLYIGDVGRGQAVEVRLSRYVNYDGIRYYDYAFVPISSIPKGWFVQNSSNMSQPLQLIIKVNESAKPGDYLIPIKLVDYYEGLPNITIFVRITVREDIFNSYIEREFITTGIQQPATQTIYVENKGHLGELFKIVIQCPSSTVERSIYVKGKDKGSVRVSHYFDVEGVYTCNVSVYSVSSFEEREFHRYEVRVKSSIMNDLKALAEGLVLLYPTEMLITSFAAFFS